jgi:UDP-3-O-[3-hydroxymyristoyl] glucosamine N-acyltransferase
MEKNIESILLELGIDYHLSGNIKKTFRNVATIEQGKEEDLCYCSFDGEEALSLISKSNAGIILWGRLGESYSSKLPFLRSLKTAIYFCG